MSRFLRTQFFAKNFNNISTSQNLIRKTPRSKWDNISLGLAGVSITCWSITIAGQFYMMFVLPSRWAREDAEDRRARRDFFENEPFPRPDPLNRH